MSETTPGQIALDVLREVRRELVRYTENAESGTTAQDAAADVVQRLYDVYGVRPVIDMRLFRQPEAAPMNAEA